MRRNAITIDTAQDPNATLEELSACAESWPSLVIENPVMDLYAMSDPAGWLEVLRKAWNFYEHMAFQYAADPRRFVGTRADLEAYAEWVKESLRELARERSSANRRDSEAFHFLAPECLESVLEMEDDIALGRKPHWAVTHGRSAILHAFSMRYADRGIKGLSGEEIGRSMPLRLAHLERVCRLFSTREERPRGQMVRNGRRRR